MLSSGLGSLCVGVINKEIEYAGSFNRSIGIRAGLHLIAQGKVGNDSFAGCGWGLAGGCLCGTVGTAFIPRGSLLAAVVWRAEVPCRIASHRNRNRTLPPAFEWKHREADN